MNQVPINSESESDLNEVKKDRSLLYIGIVLGIIILVMAYLALFVDDVGGLFNKKVALQQETTVSEQLDESLNRDDSEIRSSLTKFIEAFYYDQKRGYFDPPSYFATITQTYYNYHNLTHQRLRDLHYKRLSEMRNLQQNWIVSSLDFDHDDRKQLVATYWVQMNYFHTLKNAQESADVKHEIVINQEGKIVSLRELEVKNFSSVPVQESVSDSLTVDATEIPDDAAAIADAAKIQHAETGGRYEGRVYDLGTVETPPEFPTGQSELVRFIAANIHYPAKARVSKIQGKVYVSFVVERNGDINGIQVVKGIGGGCDEEAIRVLRSTAPWKPGTVAGKPVRTAYTIPVNFKL